MNALQSFDVAAARWVGRIRVFGEHEMLRPAGQCRCSVCWRMGGRVRSFQDYACGMCDRVYNLSWSAAGWVCTDTVGCVTRRGRSE